MDFNLIWYFLIGALLTGYAVLDGFDLGVGGLHLLAKGDNERRLFLNAIGPVWDGNEVWLVTGGGALFAAFPDVYASVFSGFYIPFLILLVMLIFRAVAIEFRSKETMKWWRQFWDVSFSFSSIISSFLIGVVIGNMMWGLPVDEKGEIGIGFLELLNPYALLVGVTTVALFMMHGSIYLVMKTEGELHDKIRGWINHCIIFFVMCYITTTMVTLLYVSHAAEYIKEHPVLFIVPFLNMLAIANIPREIFRGRDFRAFLSSCAAMVALMALFAIAMFPNLVFSNPNPENSLTYLNSASSARTLKIMFIIALSGIPFVLAYTISIYWIFRGKVKLDETSY